MTKNLYFNSDRTYCRFASCRHFNNCPEKRAFTPVVREYFRKKGIEYLSFFMDKPECYEPNYSEKEREEIMAVYEILNEMHRFIGIEPPKGSFDELILYYTEKDWFTKHTWKMEDEKRFLEHMINLFKNRKKWKEIRKKAGLPSSKKLLMIKLKDLMFYCGWKYSDFPKKD